MSSIVDEIQTKLTTLNEDSLRGVLSAVNREFSLQARGVPSSDRYNLFPIKDEQVYAFYKQQQKFHWTADELLEDLESDSAMFKKLPPSIQRIFYAIFGFFAGADGLISNNVDRFSIEAETYEQSLFFKAQNFMEAIHSESYGLAISIILRDDPQRDAVYTAIDHLPCVQRKEEFMRKYSGSDLSWGLRAVASAAMEGVFFMGLFGIIFYFRSSDILPGFMRLNSLVQRDETLHRDYYCLEARRHLKPEEHALARQILREAVEVEAEYIKYILSEPIESLEQDAKNKITAADLEIYLKMLVDQILDKIGLSLEFNVDIYLPYTDNTSSRTAFYDKTNSQYVSTSYSIADVNEKISGKKARRSRKDLF